MDAFFWHDLERLIPVHAPPSSPVERGEKHEAHVFFVKDLVQLYGLQTVKSKFLDAGYERLTQVPEAERAAFLNKIARDLRS